MTVCEGKVCDVVIESCSIKQPADAGVAAAPHHKKPHYLLLPHNTIAHAAHIEFSAQLLLIGGNV